MVKRHKILAHIKEEHWRKLWQLKSYIMEKPFSKVIETLIDEYFERNQIVFDEDIKREKKN